MDKVKLRLNSMIGKKFGRLVITGFDSPLLNNKGRRIHMAICKCDCGNAHTTYLHSVKAGVTKSCGCLAKEVFSSVTTKHGLARTPLYKVFDSMRERCYNPNNIGYKDYGGRGIRICQEWLSDFTLFYNWAIENGWQKGLEIDRFPDNNGNYEPNNCRFVTPKVNSNNKNCNIFLEYKGVKRPLLEWCRIKNISKSCLYGRINYYGWTVDEALSTPVIRKSGNFR